MFSSLDKAPVVKNIIIINVVVFLLMNFSSLAQFYTPTSLHYFNDPDFGVWQIVTHMFQHALLKSQTGIWHLIFNMFVLFQFGAVLEERWNSKRFLIFYLAAGIGSVFMTYLSQAGISMKLFGTILPHTDITNFPDGYFGYAVGASGAISGVVAAFAFYFPNTKLMLLFLPVPIKAKYLVSAFILIDLILGIWTMLTQAQILTGSMGYYSNVGNIAHFGGVIFGMLLVLYWQKNRNSFY